MAFPTTGILSTFSFSGDLNQIDTAEWDVADAMVPSGPLAADGAFLIKGFSGAYDASYWSVEQFGPDCEAYLEWADNDAGSANFYVGIRVRVEDPTVDDTAYRASYGSAGGSKLFLYHLASGVDTQLGSSYTHTPTTGQAWGIEVIGNTIKAYTNEGSGWTERISHSDSSISGAGYIVLDAYDPADVLRWDNFGGGTIDEGEPEPPADVAFLQPRQGARW